MKVQNSSVSACMQANNRQGHITHFTKPGKIQEMSWKNSKSNIYACENMYIFYTKAEYFGVECTDLLQLTVKFLWSVQKETSDFII